VDMKRVMTTVWWCAFFSDAGWHVHRGTQRVDCHG
jgi:hypothetical protein